MAQSPILLRKVAMGTIDIDLFVVWFDVIFINLWSHKSDFLVHEYLDFCIEAPILTTSLLVS